MMKIFVALTVLALAQRGSYGSKIEGASPTSLANASQYQCKIECRDLKTSLKIDLDNVAWVCSWLDIANPIPWKYISGFICKSQECKYKCGFENKIKLN